MAVKTHAIVSFFADEPKLVRRGENVVGSNSVSNFVFDADFAFLRASVESSMKDKVYDVKIELNCDGEVAIASCQCRRGNVRCHHMAAVLLHAQKNTGNISDGVPSRRKRTSAKSRPAIPTDILYPEPRPFLSLKTPFSQMDIENFRRKLSYFSPTIGFSWLLAAEPDPGLVTIRTVEDVIFSSEFVDSPDKYQFLIENLQVSLEEITATAETTCGPDNLLRNVVKKGRVSTSLFGAIISAWETRKFPPSLFKNLLGSYTLETVKEEQWEIQKKDLAISVFEEHTGLKVVPTGVWLHPTGLMCACPDGFIGTDSIIEVKCPLKFSTLEKSLLDALKKEKDYILLHGAETEEAILNTEHVYYHQAQGKLCFTNRKTCFFVIWSPNDVIITKIEKNDLWEDNLHLLMEFYKTQFFGILLDKNKFF